VITISHFPALKALKIIKKKKKKKKKSRNEKNKHCCKVRDEKKITSNEDKRINSKLVRARKKEKIISLILPPTPLV
jgi:hypothetical protein